MSDIALSIVARCLVDPAFLTAMQADPEHALGDYMLDPATREEMGRLDVKRVRLFAGFICKVQHNHLWQWFPATRALMAFFGIELEVFSRFRLVQCSPKWKTITRNDRIRAFAGFAASVVPELLLENRLCPGLVEAIEHELMVWEVSLQLSEAPVDPGLSASTVSTLPWAEAQRLVPRVRRPHRIRSYGIDPAKLVATVVAGSFDGCLPQRSNETLLYWAAPKENRVDVLNIDPVAAHLLGQCDGRRSVRAVIRRLRHLGLDGIPPKAIWSLLVAALEQGLLCLSQRE